MSSSQNSPRQKVREKPLNVVYQRDGKPLKSEGVGKCACTFTFSRRYGDGPRTTKKGPRADPIKSEGSECGSGAWPPPSSGSDACTKVKPRKGKIKYTQTEKDKEEPCPPSTAGEDSRPALSTIAHCCKRWRSKQCQQASSTRE